jgi:hypothetical protein
MNKRPELTVVIPVTKVKSNLELLNFNLLVAKLCRFQVIIVHDVKDEESGPLIRYLISDLNNCLLIEGQFGTAGKARNQALAHIETEWIAFWDSDDKIIPNNFLYLWNKTKLDANSIGIGNFLGSDVSGKVNVSSKISNQLGKNIVTFPGIWRYIFRKDSIDGLKFSNALIGEDVQFISEALSRNSKFTTTNLPIYKYTMHSDLQTTQNIKNYDGILELLGSLQEIMLREVCFNRQLVFYLYIRQYFSLLKRGKVKDKFTATQRAVRFFNKQENFTKLQISQALLETLIKPNSNCIRIDKEKKTVVYLHGGLGNQLFQLTELLEKLPANEFEIISKTPDIFEEYQLVCPIQLPIAKNYQLSDRISSKFGDKLIKLVLRLNHIISLDNKVLKNLTNIIEINYLRFLQITFFRGYIIISDNSALKNKFEITGKPKVFIGYFQFNKREISNSTIEYFKALLKFEQVNVISEYRERVKNEVPLVVHVRLGDYQKIKNLDVVTLDYYLNAIKEIDLKFRYNRIWLFSNDPFLATEMLPGNLLVRISTININPKNDFIDFQLMRLGEAFVIPNSTFSWWAVRLSESEQPVVAVPRKWFEFQENPIDLFPEDWLRIQN